MLKGFALRSIQAALRALRYLTTGKDNTTPDVIRIGGILLGIQFLALAAWNHSSFDPLAYGGGAAALLAAIGAALRLKAPDEPTG
jgi:hypothetical protein